MGMGQIVDYSQFILQIEKAIANGVASLDSNAKVPKNQISLNASDVGAIATGGTAGTANQLTAPRTISTTGDATYSVSFDGSANVSSAITLANSGVTAGTYNALSTQVRPFTVDAKGRITGVGTPVDITPPWSAITGKPTTLNGYGITDALNLAGGNVTGNLGLGVSSPTVKLSIGRLGGAFSVPTLNSNTAALITAGGGVAASGSFLSILGGNTSQVAVTFGDSDAAEQGGIYYNNSTDTLDLRAGNSNRISISSGTTTFSSTTTSTSTTTGAICAASLGITGAIFAGSYNLIPVGRGGGNIDSNIVIGVSAGNVNTTGNNNSFVGVYAGNANTTGSSNSFVGVYAGNANTTGNDNSFVGVSAGRSNTTGSSNSFVGVSAGNANTTGSSNSFVGVSAGRSNTTGSSNSFVGVSAGRFIGNGVTGLTVINNSCFFGMNTKGTENAINENVFGYNATGNGSNTVTIGDSAITNTYLRGVVSTDSTATSTSTTTGAIRAASLGITGAIFADSVNATSKIAVGQNFSISSISGYSNISLGNNLTSEYGQSSIEIPTNTLYGGNNQHHTGVKLVCGEMVGWGTAKFKIYTSNNWTTYNPIACFSVGDDGGTFLGSAKATSFFVGANQVVSARRTGYTPSTGTLSRGAFNTETVTLLELARQFHALRTDLTTHGLIGA